VVRRWLTAVSLSGFHKLVPPLSDETFQLFVQFFWLVKTGDRQKANQLLADTRREWGLEARLDVSSVNRLLASGDGYALLAFAVSHWALPPRSGGQASRAVSKRKAKVKMVSMISNLL